jgi:hypothetical protein
MRIQANPCQNRRTGKRGGADIHSEVASVGGLFAESCNGPGSKSASVIGARQ